MPKSTHQADTQLWRTVRAQLEPLCQEAGYQRVAEAIGVTDRTLRSSIQYGHNGMTGTTLDKLLEVFGLEMQIIIKPKEDE